MSHFVRDVNVLTDNRNCFLIRSIDMNALTGNHVRNKLSVGTVLNSKFFIKKILLPLHKPKEGFKRYFALKSILYCGTLLLPQFFCPSDKAKGRLKLLIT